ncbi:MAG: hypothetical protein U0451_03520 [Candidatus Saccharimonadales bacterium]
MDWNNRGPSTPPNAAHQNVNPTHPSSVSGTNPQNPRKGRARFRNADRKWRIASVVLLFAITLLVISVIVYLAFFNNSSKRQSTYVDSSKFQAVFLNGGQVYFGKIKYINSNYMRLEEIYYLRVNQQVQPNAQSNSNSNDNVQLVKLGCELHGPQDQMLINADQVVFWENLKTDGQVSQAIAKYVSENPNGQQCQTQNSNSNNNTPGSETTKPVNP